jgi:hypothetical protein
MSRGYRKIERFCSADVRIAAIRPYLWLKVAAIVFEKGLLSPKRLDWQADCAIFDACENK